MERSIIHQSTNYRFWRTLYSNWTNWHRNGANRYAGLLGAKTLFNLGKITGGYALEDAIFMFIAGGITAASYETIFRKRIIVPKKPRHHSRALIIGAFAAALFAIVFPLNLIYSLITFGLAGAATIWLERKDLIGQSLFGGGFFALIYFSSFLFFNFIFPGFVSHVFHIENLSGIFISGVPLEELLYAASFGLLWTPIYEYGLHGRDMTVV